MTTLEARAKKAEYDRDYRSKNRERRKSQNKEHYEGVRRKKFLENPSRYLWGVAKVRAKQFGYDFDIDPEDVIVPEACPITGRFLLKTTGYSPDSPSLDRVNNDRGYVKGNIRVISRWANLKKSSLTEADLVALLAYTRGEI